MKSKLFLSIALAFSVSALAYYIAAFHVMLGGTPPADIFRRTLIEPPAWFRIITFGYADPLWPGFRWRVFDLLLISSLFCAGGFFLRGYYKLKEAKDAKIPQNTE